MNKSGYNAVWADRVVDKGGEVAESGFLPPHFKLQTRHQFMNNPG